MNKVLDKLMKIKTMSNEDLKRELVELIKYYQQIIYMYNQYSTYNNPEHSYLDAVQRLEYYNEEYCKLLK